MNKKDNQPMMTPLTDHLRRIPEKVVLRVQKRTQEGMLYSSSNLPVGRYAHEAANLIEHQEKRINKLENPWISVKDELPKQWEYVYFVTVDGDYVCHWFGCLDEESQWRADETDEYGNNIYPELEGIYGTVKYFMPIPPLPEQEKV